MDTIGGIVWAISLLGGDYAWDDGFVTSRANINENCTLYYIIDVQPPTLRVDLGFLDIEISREQLLQFQAMRNIGSAHREAIERVRNGLEWHSNSDLLRTVMRSIPSYQNYEWVQLYEFVAMVDELYYRLAKVGYIDVRLWK